MCTNRIIAQNLWDLSTALPALPRVKNATSRALPALENGGELPR
jgi:hypothetical protein